MQTDHAVFEKPLADGAGHTFLNGVLISAMWGWFVVPATGARPIGIAQALGLSMFISVAGDIATAHINPVIKQDDTAGSAIIKGISVGIIAPLISLAIGWAWHTFALD